MHALPAGPDAVLLDFGHDDDPVAAVRHAASALRAATRDGALRAVADVVPAAQTILVQFESGCGADALGIVRALRTTRTTGDDTSDDAVTEIAVTYDGADLDAVAETLATTTAQVIAWHVGTPWRVQFMGFAPGFGYLVPEGTSPNPLTTLGRRDEPRTRVPRGAVAVAAGYSAVYPRSSPGGWHLLGHTEIALWDADATPPSVLTPGARVRFVEAPGRRTR